MRDQANELRNLVLRAARENSAAAGPPPRIIVLTGGKGGVGTTTLAVNLSVTLSQQGRRVVLVDADLEQADVAPLCGLPERCSISDVLGSRRSIHEVLEPGPAGIQVIPGLWGSSRVSDHTPAVQQRLLHQLQTLGRHADVVVIDSGRGTGPVTNGYWLAADQVLLVTTPDSVAVMDAYATIKVQTGEIRSTPLLVVMNQVLDETVATEAFRRLVVSCQRFLGLTCGLGEMIPLDKRIPLAAADSTPLMIKFPICEAARAIDRLAASISVAATTTRAAA